MSRFSREIGSCDVTRTRAVTAKKSTASSYHLGLGNAILPDTCFWPSESMPSAQHNLNRFQAVHFIKSALEPCAKFVFFLCPRSSISYVTTRNSSCAEDVLVATKFPHSRFWSNMVIILMPALFSSGLGTERTNRKSSSQMDQRT